MTSSTPEESSLLQLADYSRHVLLVGALTLEVATECSTSRVAAEAPLPVFYESDRTLSLGGVAGTARNLDHMGITVNLVSCVGADDHDLRECIEREKFPPDHVIKIDGYTAEVTTRYFSDGYQTFQAVKKASLGTNGDAQDKILQRVKELMNEGSYSAVMVMEDHNGLITNELMNNIGAHCIGLRVPVLFRTSGSDLKMYKHSNVLLTYNVQTYNKIINDNEIVKENVSGSSNQVSYPTMIAVSPTEILYCESKGSELTRDAASFSKLVTKDRLPAVNSAVIAAVAFGVSCGLAMERMVSLAVQCGNLVSDIKHDHAVNITEILPSNVITTNELANFSALLPRNKKIVLTTGCFDLYHACHARTLEIAKEQGDILIVLLNSDESIRLLKGPKRPIYPLHERIMLLQSVKYVDFIVPFDEKSPYWQMETIAPDVFFKGDGYDEEYIMRRYPFLNKYVTISPRVDRTTTKTIDKILKAYSSESS